MQEIVEQKEDDEDSDPNESIQNYENSNSVDNTERRENYITESKNDDDSSPINGGTVSVNREYTDENNENHHDRSSNIEGEDSSNENLSENSEEEKERNPHEQPDTEVDRDKAIKLEEPFYDINEFGSIDIERTASFGEGQDLLRCMPSFAKFGLLSTGIKNKLEANKDSGKVKTQAVQGHEVGPEYLSIDPANNLQSGFFYLAHEDEKNQFEK